MTPSSAEGRGSSDDSGDVNPPPGTAGGGFLQLFMEASARFDQSEQVIHISDNGQR